MSFRVEVVIPGEPIGQGRPRFARRGTFVTAYDPPKSRDWKSGARACMMAEKRRLQAAWDELSAQNKEVAA